MLGLAYKSASRANNIARKSLKIKQESARDFTATHDSSYDSYFANY